MHSASVILLHPSFQAFWVLLICVATEKLFAWPYKYHPLSLARLVAERLAIKVNPYGKASHSQQRISGAMAVLILLLPQAAIVTFITSIAEYPLFFDGLLLLIALQFQPVIDKSRKVSKLLANNKKVLARDVLASISLRETDKLSPLGIAKGTIESLLLRFNYQFTNVLFWYLLLGGEAALSYRLLYEFCHCWNSKLIRFQHFGYPAAYLLYLLQWLPNRLSLVSMALAENISGAWQGFKSLSGSYRPHNLLLAVAGGALGIQLGGPAYYDGRKVRSIKCGGARQVRHGDLQRSVALVVKTQAVVIVMCILLTALLYLLSIRSVI
jgi:adenosylcobinamide-phosphate synthase